MNFVLITWKIGNYSLKFFVSLVYQNGFVIFVDTCNKPKGEIRITVYSFRFLICITSQIIIPTL